MRAYQQAFRKILGKLKLYIYAASIPILISIYRGERGAAVVKLIMVIIGLVLWLGYEMFKEMRRAKGVSWLTGRQLKKRFFISVIFLSLLYVVASLCLAFFDGDPNGLGDLFPIYLPLLILFAVLFYWEMKELNEMGGRDDVQH